MHPAAWLELAEVGEQAVGKAAGFPAWILTSPLNFLCLLRAEPVAAPAAAAARHGDTRRRAEPAGPAGHRRGHPGCPGAHLCWGGPLNLPAGLVSSAEATAVPSLGLVLCVGMLLSLLSCGEHWGQLQILRLPAGTRPQDFVQHGVGETWPLQFCSLWPVTTSFPCCFIPGPPRAPPALNGPCSVPCLACGLCSVPGCVPDPRGHCGGSGAGTAGEALPLWEVLVSTADKDEGTPRGDSGKEMARAECELERCP